MMAVSIHEILLSGDLFIKAYWPAIKDSELAKSVH